MAQQKQGPQQDLFGKDITRPEIQRRDTWYLVTNQLNLMMMLSASLIMPPKGFGKKFYADPLGVFPGWIPLFLNRIPSKALEMAVEEDPKILNPMIVELDLSPLRGKAFGVSEYPKVGEPKDITVPHDLIDTWSAILLPAPLPTTLIKAVNFRSKQDKDAFENDCQSYPNVPMSHFTRKVAVRLFQKAYGLLWPPQGITLPERDRAMGHCLAAGAMGAMTLHFGNLGATVSRACRTVFKAMSGEAESLNEPILRGLGEWVRTGQQPTQEKDPTEKIYWGLIGAISAMGHDAIHGDLLKDIVLDYLESVKSDIPIQIAATLSNLIQELRSLAGFGDAGMSELFQRHTGFISRALILFFERDHCLDLVPFRHALLNEIDYLAAALLLAARDKWIGLPLELREYPGLADAVSHGMAVLAHRMDGSEIVLERSAVRCAPLWEWFEPGPEGWINKQEKSALELVRARRWDCINTVIQVGKGEFKIEVGGGGVRFTLPGDMQGVKFVINKNQFFASLAKDQIPLKWLKKHPECCSGQ